MKYIEITLEKLSVRYTKFTYDFTQKGCRLTPASSVLTGLEMALLGAAGKRGLTLSRVHSRGKIARVYRIADDHSFVDFVLHSDGAKIQKISVSSEDFLLNCFVKTLFECGSEWIARQLTRNDELAMLARLGFATDPKSKTLALMAPSKLPE